MYETEEGQTVRDQLDGHFGIDAIPTVVLLKRNPLQQNAFTLMAMPPLVPDGRDGRQLLGRELSTAEVDKLLGDRPVLWLDNSLSQLDRNVSLVVLCEHLLPRSAEFHRLENAVDRVANEFADRPEVKARQWPKLKFVVAPGPPSAQSTWFRTACGLPAATHAKDTLEVLVLEKRWAGCEACYMMRGVCALERLPYDLPSLVSDGGKRLLTLLEVFCSTIQPHMMIHTQPEGSPLHEPPIRMRYLGN